MNDMMYVMAYDCVCLKVARVAEEEGVIRGVVYVLRWWERKEPWP